MRNDTFEKDLPGILLLSHGPLCTALLESARMIMGEAPNTVALPLLENADVSEYGANAIRLFRSMPEGSIILFDIASGTPFNQVLTQCGGEKFSGLCGMNLAILLEALSLRDMMKGDELIRSLQETAHESIVNLENFFSEVT
jgi:mannose/fructose-specific phosphotransferase system component IIA